MAGLTTHVLDTGLGRPAAGVEIELFELSATGRGLWSPRLRPTPTDAPTRR